MEQEAVCLRYVDKDLDPKEEFIGLYEVSSTTGESLAKVVQDVLDRLNLPISGLRGQAYDGAANMAGKHNGAQAIIRKAQPLAPYVHCAAHCVNLRFTGSAPAHIQASPAAYYRSEFYQVLDTVEVQFKQRFEQEGMVMLRDLEAVLLTGHLTSVVGQYPEIQPDALKVQLQMFSMKYSFETIADVVTVLKGMTQKFVDFLTRLRQSFAFFLWCQWLRLSQREVLAACGD
ncbi:hypothetical protein WMY93_029762 [Mugilogobius chulae]|uniref:DUF4371 domain-containing protein n=1 Tax=Mugilogobius chulae TaxID=88201 RepID=A0AAW0MXW6_9GOBI